MGIKLTIIYAIYGRYDLIETELTNTLNQVINELNDSSELVIVCDGKKWTAAPFLQIADRNTNKSIRILVSDPEQSIPAKLFNSGIEKSRGEYIVLVEPGSRVNVRRMLSSIQESTSERAVFAVSQVLLNKMGVTPKQLKQWLFFYIRCANLFRLEDVIIPRHVFEILGAFNETQLLQKYFDWEFFTRLLYHNIEFEISILDESDTSEKIDDFPYELNYRTPKILSYQVLLHNIVDPDVNFGGNEITILQDIPYSEREYLEPIFGIGSNFRSTRKRPIKIGIISGVNDYVHTKLTFYNYLDYFRKFNIFTEISFLDVLVDPDRDMHGLDLVVIVRGRVPQLYKLLSSCKRSNLPVIYMIDDNWFWVGKDWSEQYGQLFGDDSEAMSVFTYCLREASAVLVYNPLLAQDVSHYTNRIITLPININKESFREAAADQQIAKVAQELSEWRSRCKGLLVGYSGSTRYTKVAFEALANVARKNRDNIKILLFGHILPEQKELFHGLDVIELKYMSYELYACAISSLKPDILIAPLDETRSSMSKAANKYLEYGIGRAAGIYSNLPPYKDIVINNTTGLLVPNNEEDWEKAISKLIHDEELRNKIVNNAEVDVLTHYETTKVAEKFLKAILEISFG